MHDLYLLGRVPSTEIKCTEVQKNTTWLCSCSDKYGGGCEKLAAYSDCNVINSAKETLCNSDHTDTK